MVREDATPDASAIIDEQRGSILAHIRRFLRGVGDAVVNTTQAIAGWEQARADWVRSLWPATFVMRHRRWFLWVMIGVLALSFAGLKETSTLLRSVEGQGSRSYEGSAYTGFKLNPTDTEELRAATRLWRCSDPELATSPNGCEPDEVSSASAPVRRLVRSHHVIDLLGFVPAYSALIGVLLLFTGVRAHIARRLSLAVFVTDGLETSFSAFLFWGDLKADTGCLVLLQCLTFAKYAAIASAVIPLIASAVRNPNGWSVGDAMAEIRYARGGGQEHPAIALAPLILLAALFAGFVALPAGGPLDQIPDVLRHQMFEIGDGDIALLFGSGGALVALAVGLAIAGILATDWKAPTTESLGRLNPLVQSSSLMASMDANFISPEERKASDLKVLGVAAAVSLSLLLAAYVFEGHWAFSTLALLIFCAAVVALARLLDAAGVHLTASPKEADRKAAEDRTADERRLWIGGLAGAAVVAGGIGFGRATFPVFLLKGEAIAWWWSWDLPWLFFTTLGVMTSVFAGVIVQWLVVVLDKQRQNVGPRGSLGWWLAAVGSAMVIGFIAIRLAKEPEFAHFFGTPGVAAMVLAFFALLLGLVLWATRRLLPRWEVTDCLGAGVRTPWLTLIVATWVVASLMDTEGGYHDARSEAELGPPDHRYVSIDDAFGAWRVHQRGADLADGCATTGNTRVPLVLVAAPGGGIKAAYWTERALNRLFADTDRPCAMARLFAISGVSGGAVGATTWIAAKPADDGGTRSETAMGGMAGDRALSSAVAGLLLRDLPQPFTGMKHKWRDRAALLEDGWIDSASEVYGSREDPLAWQEVGGPPPSRLSNDEPSPWTAPVLILNSSSVNDACRLLVTNTGGLTAGDVGKSCYTAPEAGEGSFGPVTGALDAFESCDYDQDKNTPMTTLNPMRAVTAALLSARFPVISPSGAVDRCRDGSKPSRTYAVDGGYYENSGLLTLIQLWSAIEPLADAACIADEDERVCVEPWFVVLSSGYRSAASGAEPQRPNEVSLIRATRGRLKELISERALEQTAAWQSGLLLEPYDPENPRDVVTPECAGLVHLGLTKKPSVAAPLGWVLSELTRKNLRDQLDSEFAQPDSDLARLRKRLDRPEATPGCK